MNAAPNPPAASGAPQLERVRELGRGASGHVELCLLVESFTTEEGELLPAGSEVALKTLLPERAQDAAARDALRAEAEAGRMARDPSLVRVLWHGEREGAPALLLSYVPGRSLRESLERDGPAPEPLLRSVGAQLYGALAALHAAGLVHGDVKPENVRLSAEGRAVLLDLGFARRTDAAARARERAGSLPYLSPERAQGAAPEPAGDVYALAIVLYELATGAHPFDERENARRGAPGGLAPLAGRSTGSLLKRSLEVRGADELLASLVLARYQPPSRLVPQLSPFLDALLEQALERDPRARPDARELALRLSEGERSSWWKERAHAHPGDTLGAPARGEEAHLTPLAGRERELGMLLQRYADCCQTNSGRVIWLTGPDGAGKSRLVSALVARARASSTPPVHLYARCSELDESRPAGALLVWLLRWLAMMEGEKPGVRERELLARSVTPREAAVLLAAIDPTLAEADSGAVHLALASWLEAAARQQPLIAYLDDVHAAGASTLEALVRVLERLGSARVLLVLGAREEAAAEPGSPLAALRERLAELPGHLLPLALELGPLSEEHVRELVQRLFHHSAPRLRLAAVLWQRSRGNPGLIAEILRGLIARGQLEPAPDDERRWIARIAPDRIPEPGSIAHLVQQRYRALSSEDKLWLGRLSVVGGRISPELLMRAFPPCERAEVDAVLSRLAREGWLVGAGSRYRFARPALRDAVYRSLSQDRRKRMHAAASRALEPAPGEAASSVDLFQRAWHLRAAGAFPALLKAIVPLLDALAAQGQTERVSTLAQWGLEALDGLPNSTRHEQLRVDLLGHAADAANRLGQRARERELLDRLAELALDPERAPRAAARVYLLHGRHAAGTGQYGLARGMLRNAVQLAASAKAPELESESLRRLALVQAQVGELEDARTLARRAAQRAQGEAQEQLAQLTLASLDVQSGELDRALRAVEALIASKRGAAHRLRPLPACVAQLLRARIWRAAGRPARALAAAQLALDLAKRAGERRLEAEAVSRIGGLLLDLDRGEEAESALREALLLSSEIEDRRGEALARVFLSILLWERDDPEAARAIDRAAELAREIGFVRAEAVALAIRARVARAAGELESALELSSAACELLRAGGAELIDRVVIEATHALVLRSCGDEEAAQQRVAEIEQRIESEAERVESLPLRVGLASYGRRLLQAAYSPDGPVYPRFQL